MTKKRKNTIQIMIMIVLFLSLNVKQFPVRAQQRTIKVGWPMQEGLSTTGEDGTYQGYTYDYLQEVAQYTGWRFEFVEVDGDIDTQLSELLDLLQAGEIDLLGAIRYSEATAQLFDFPSESYGTFYNVLAISKDNNEIDEYNFMRKKNLKIAVTKGSTTTLEKLLQYLSINQISYELVECENAQETVEKVRNQEADAMLGIDVSVEDDMYAIAKFGGTPFYFAATKGNYEITSKLNQAILNIQDTYPTLESELYTKYFEGKGALTLTAQEQAYIIEHPELRVIYLDDLAPLSYTNEHIAAGAAIDVMNQIADMSGLQISYIRARSFNEYRDLLAEGAYDVLLTYPYQNAISNDSALALSNPYLKIPLTLVTHNGIDANNLRNKTEAIIDDFGFRNRISETYYEAATVKDALQAVNEGKADYFYGIGAMVSYYSNQHRYDNIQLIYGVDEGYGKLCLGVNGDETSTLIAILNKSLHAISDQDLETYLYEHSSVSNELSLQDFIRRYQGQILLIVFIMSVLVVYASYRHFARLVKMKQQIELENQRYKMLSEISGESFFEYDYKKDVLKVNVDKFSDSQVYQHYREMMKNHHGIAYEETLLPLFDHPQEQCDLLLKVAGGMARWNHIVARVLYDRNAHPVVMIGRFQDIHDEVEEREKLKQDAQMDKLTNMYNANSIRELISSMIPHAMIGKSVLMIADMDHFKKINDCYGHHQGDLVLAQTGAVLNRVFSAYGLVGRLGGDEFIIYLENPGGDQKIEELCQTMFDQLEQLAAAQNIHCAIQISIGYTEVKEGQTFLQLYQNADKALYQVKDRGRNSVSKYHDGM